MGCCGASFEQEPGIVKKRSCRDVPCLILFGLFWGGMGYVAYEGIQLGNPQRILYGLDSYGQFCGVKNTRADGVVIDLSNAKKLHYLNPLDLVDPRNYQFAKTVCVKECPGAGRQCSPTSVPCTRGDQYICPYYHFSEFAPLDELNIRNEGGPGEGLKSTDWWSALPNLNSASCVDTDFLASVPTSIASAMNISEGCGQYYQMTSMYPSKGPCNPVFFETEDYMHRCYPIIPDEYYDLIVNSTVSAAASVLQSASSDAISSVTSHIGSLADNGFSTYVTDAQRGLVVVLVAGLAVSLALCLVYMVILRFCAGLMAWTTIILINALFLGASLLCAYKAALLGDVSGALGASLSEQLTESAGESLTGDQQKVMRVITIILAAITVLLILFTLLMIKRVKIAIACLKVASTAVASMPSLFLFPLVTFLSFVGLFVYWVIVLAYLWSAGDVVETYREADTDMDQYSLSTLFNSAVGNTTIPSFAAPPPPSRSNASIPCYDDPSCYYSVEFNKNLQYMFAYHIFGLLWTSQFIIGFGYVVVAGAVAQYYWSRGQRSEMPSSPVLAAVKNASTYHMGSIAFGAFIVAVIQFVRLLLEYIDRKSKKLQKNNPAARWVMCCLRYCLWYMEKVMKFINRNAYIMVAVKGTSYCTSAMRAVKLIVTNVLALAAVNIIGDALIFLGKMSVVAGSVVVAFLMTDIQKYTDPSSDSYLSSPVVPVALAAIAAYMVANIFFSVRFPGYTPRSLSNLILANAADVFVDKRRRVYEMAVDTILLSFCEDRETNNGTPQFAPKLLMNAIGKAKQYKQQQEQRKSQAIANSSGDPKAP